MKRQDAPQPGTVAARIWELRRPDETPAAFAKRLDVSQQQLYAMRIGKGTVSTDTLAQVVLQTGADPSYLLFGKDAPALKGRDRARLEEIAAILQRAGIIPSVTETERAKGRHAGKVVTAAESSPEYRKGQADQKQPDPRPRHKKPPRRAQGGRGGGA